MPARNHLAHQNAVCCPAVTFTIKQSMTQHKVTVLLLQTQLKTLSGLNKLDSIAPRVVVRVGQRQLLTAAL
jgi:hypothetical protein